MTPSENPARSPSREPTAALVLADGTAFLGQGLGAQGEAVGEVCFNTAMTGYQEILTDPSYAGQIVTFTFPHIGNVGTNEEDVEATNPAVRGLVLRAPISAPSNYRAADALGRWLSRRNIIGIAGIDTRALTRLIRERGMPKAAIVHAPGGFELASLRGKAEGWSGLEGLDLAQEVTTRQTYSAEETPWRWGKGYGRQDAPTRHVVAIDYGIKRNILRALGGTGCRVTVVPAATSAAEILAKSPDGIFLSNGPGDPAATGRYAVPVIRRLIDSGKPVFGICLGHQMLALAAGGRTVKMHQGRHGANHPVKDLSTGKVEIVSMNHGFTVERESLPTAVIETHVSLFDGTNCGLSLKDRPVFSVQYHPEASPGPHDSHYLFTRFIEAMDGRR
jgi:carbamoyl-phosphate synthase small subunit